MLSTFLKNGLISKQGKALIIPYQSWQFANLSGISFKSESGVESSSRQGLCWPRVLAEGQRKASAHPLRSLPPGRHFWNPTTKCLDVYIQCLPQSSPIFLLDLLRAVPSIPACTPKTYRVLPSLPPEHATLGALFTLLLPHALCSTQVSFLPLLFFFHF